MSRIFLVRHGQASWGAENYDALSELGHRQAAATGAWLAGQGVVPTRIISGELVRQRDSLAEVVTAADWAGSSESGPVWDEYDHLAVLAALPAEDPVYAASAASVERRAFDALEGKQAQPDRCQPGGVGHGIREPVARGRRGERKCAG